MSIGRRIERREFLATSAAAASSALLGCNRDNPAEPYIPPDTTTPPLPVQVVAEISGPDTLQGVYGGDVLATFTSEKSTGPISQRTWAISKDADPFDPENAASLGEGESAQVKLVRPGTYTVTLEVKGGGTGSSDEHQTTVEAPSLPGSDYPLVSFIRHEDAGNDRVAMILHFMNPNTGRVTRIGGNTGLLGQQTSWERGGGRLATDFGSGSFKLMTYNLLTDELVEIGHPQAQNSWIPSWNPNPDREWIAYIEKRRADYSEPALVRPDGSERIYLAGETPSNEVSGFYPSWDPEGERLALGLVNYDLTGRLDVLGVPDKRIAIFDNFWNGGTSHRVQVPTEEQIRAFLETQGDNNQFNLFYLSMAYNGLSFSPDGEWLAYTFYYGTDNHKEFLVKSRVDGTGGIEELLRGAAREYPFGPRWSPDGSQILFSANVNGEYSRIFTIPANGGSPSQLVFTSEGLGDSSPAWYM